MDSFFSLMEIGVMIFILGVVAWIGPSNNYDSMVYHLPRVIHWMQDRNVAFFPCVDLRQIEMAPGAEYIILHLQILNGGGDRFSTLVQWFAYVGSIAGISLAAGLLGAGWAGQVFAAVFTATIPMACFQAVSTQNDLVAAFWLICFFVFLLSIWKSPHDPPPSRVFQYLLAGLSLGLAMLTKSTVYLFAAPFCLGLVIIMLRGKSWKALGGLAIVAAAAVVLNLPTYARNYRFNHHLLGGGGVNDGGAMYYNNPIGPGAAVSNLLRNSALELGNPSPAAQNAIESSVLAIHRALGLDPQNPKTTWPGMRFSMSDIAASEDSQPNPVHFLLLLAAGITLIFAGRTYRAPRDTSGGTLRFPPPVLRGRVRVGGEFMGHRPPPQPSPGVPGEGEDGPPIASRTLYRAPLLYALAIGAGFILFCACLRWQPWHSRLLLPLLIAGGAFAGIVMEQRWNRGVALTLAFFLPWFAQPAVFHNLSHPLSGRDSIFKMDRDERYFLMRPALYDQCRQVVDLAAAHHCRQIGLWIGPNEWEYPLEMMLRAALPGVRIEDYPHDGVHDAAELHTANLGWREDRKPWIVVKISGDLVIAFRGSEPLYSHAAAIVEGATADGWISSAGIDLDLVDWDKSKSPVIHLHGANWSMNYWPHAPKVFATLQSGPFSGSLPLTATFSDSDYDIRMDASSAPAGDAPCRIHLAFDGFFVPKDVNLGPDTRELVTRAPDVVQLLPGPR